MKISFNIKHLGFVMNSLWDFKISETNEGKEFAFQAMNALKKSGLTTADSVELETSLSVIVLCFAAMRQSPYGYTNAVASAMKSVVVTQLITLSNNDAASPNEAYQTLIEIQKMGEDDDIQTERISNEGLKKMGFLK